MEQEGTEPPMSAAVDDPYERFVALFARHEPVLRGFVRSLLPTWRDVDDVMQEVGLTCWRKFASFGDETDVADEATQFIRWACVIARFEALRHRRNCARDRLIFNADVMALLADDAEARAATAEAERQAVQHCLGRLAEPERRLVLSIHTPGDSVAKIAADTGQKARRLYSKVNMLRSLIQDCVQQRLEGQSRASTA